MGWLPPHPFYPIIDTGICEEHGLAPRQVAAACLDAGVRLLQLRMKTGGSGDFLALAEDVVEAARPSRALVIVNDRTDVARMSGAAGVHLGQEDLPPDLARTVLGSGLVGVSTHDPRQVDEALRTSVDYLAVGPIYATGTKRTGYGPRGLDLIRYASGRGKPVVAIGGITLRSAPDVLAAGAAAVAVISDILLASELDARLREYVQALDGAH